MTGARLPPADERRVPPCAAPAEPWRRRGCARSSAWTSIATPRRGTGTACDSGLLGLYARSRFAWRCSAAPESHVTPRGGSYAARTARPDIVDRNGRMLATD